MVAPATVHDHLHHELTLARREALAILRRTMQGKADAPTPDQLKAAIAILRLPKHVCADPGQAGDERPPEPPLPSPTPPPANPRVSPSPEPPALPDTPAPHSSSPPSPGSTAVSAVRPHPIPGNPAVTRLLTSAGAAHPRHPRATPPRTGPPPG